MRREVYFWDMDHTLINNDCDVSWKEFLVRRGVAPASALARAEGFYQDYLRGELDIEAFQLFQFEEFRGRSLASMRELCLEHYRDLVAERVYAAGRAMVAEQLAQGLELCLITSTNRYIAEPVAAALGIRHLRATGLELDERGSFTGRRQGRYMLGLAKVEEMQDFFREHGGDLGSAHYYGDSSNDIPIMERVGHPHCVNPSGKLREAAVAHGWEILHFS